MLPLKPIANLTPFTLQDFPGHTACIVWLAGCNMRCHYCHNPELVTCAKGDYPVEKLFDFLATRQGKLDGVAFTGGESTLYPDLLPLLRQVRAMGFKVKLDTNGLRPEIVRNLLAEGLVDYFAVDYKAPPEKYKLVTGTEKYAAFSETLDMLCAQTAVSFEMRTTVHTDLLDENDIQWIMDDLKQRGCTAPYFVQNYTHTNTLGGLPEQARRLDVGALGEYSFQVRNF